MNRRQTASGGRSAIGKKATPLKRQRWVAPSANPHARGLARAYARGRRRVQEIIAQRKVYDRKIPT